METTTSTKNATDNKRLSDTQSIESTEKRIPQPSDMAFVKFHIEWADDIRRDMANLLSKTPADQSALHEQIRIRTEMIETILSVTLAYIDNRFELEELKPTISYFNKLSTLIDCGKLSPRNH